MGGLSDKGHAYNHVGARVADGEGGGGGRDGSGDWGLSLGWDGTTRSDS